MCGIHRVRRDQVTRIRDHIVLLAAKPTYSMKVMSYLDRALCSSFLCSCDEISQFRSSPIFRYVDCPIGSINPDRGLFPFFEVLR